MLHRPCCVHRAGIAKCEASVWAYRSALTHCDYGRERGSEQQNGEVYRILMSLAIAVLFLLLWKKGYAFGQWLYAMLN